MIDRRIAGMNVRLATEPFFGATELLMSMGELTVANDLISKAESFRGTFFGDSVATGLVSVSEDNGMKILLFPKMFVIMERYEEFRERIKTAISNNLENGRAPGQNLVVDYDFLKEVTHEITAQEKSNVCSGEQMNIQQRINEHYREIEKLRKQLEACEHEYGEPHRDHEERQTPITENVPTGSDFFNPVVVRYETECVKVWRRACKKCGFTQTTQRTEPVVSHYRPVF